VERSESVARALLKIAAASSAAAIYRNAFGEIR
jgi:hypothetical protein